MENKKILIVGGYGGVGRTTARILSNEMPGQVIVAGRNYQKASDLSVELNGRVIPLQLDISDPNFSENLFDDVALVVMCVDQHETKFVEECIRRGINYIDITASYDFFSKLEVLNEDAKTKGSTIVLSVGLAPGLTNLLASYAKSKLLSVEHIDIFILLGLGEEHGEAAVRWTVENLNTEFQIYDAEGSRLVQSFTEGKDTLFPEGLGRRKAYRFDFSDQHIITQTLDIRSASTWLCFDSALVTNLIAFSAKLKILKLLRYRAIQNAVVSMLRRVQVGTDIFVLKAQAFTKADSDDPSFEYAVIGYGEGHATGIVAAKVALLVFKSILPSGLFHLEQLVEPQTFFEQLGDEGMRFFS